MAVTGPSSTLPTASAVGTESLSPRSAPASTDAPSKAVTATPATPEVADTPKAQPELGPSTFTFSVHYDLGTHRLILEARDPVTGFVIYQQPRKYILKQFSASVNAVIPPTRGGRLDNAV